MCAAEAVPKRILDLMNVEGLTRENVASHLQVSCAQRDINDQSLGLQLPGAAPVHHC